MRYDAYLLDADDTLFDFDLAEKAAFRQVFRDEGLIYAEDTLRLYKEISRGLWAQLERGEITKEELQARRFSELFSRLDIAVDGLQMNNAYVLALGAQSHLIDGAEELCRTLAENRKRIYIVTNGVSVTQKMRIGNAGINRYLSGIFVSEDAGFPKPQKEYFDYVFSRIPDLDRVSTIIVGDSLDSDIRGGVRAGIDTCWFNRDGRQNVTELKPTYEITQLMELIMI